MESAEHQPTPLEMLRLPKPIGSVRTVWPSEPADFTPWLAKNLDVLEVLGLGPLESPEKEVEIPGTSRALDLLVHRKDGGQRIAIENQYKTQDHDHLTCGLAYAVALQAEALVLIAEDHLGEFKAVADYLNRLTEKSTADQRIGVYLVSLAVEMVEQYFVPRFTVVAAPNNWLSDVKPPGMGMSVEALLEAVPLPRRAAVAAVVNWWGKEVGTIRTNAQTAISLDRPHPTNPERPLSYCLLNKSGTYTVQRGYLRETGVVPSDRDEEFDDLLHKWFPDLSWTGKYYYLTSSGPPDLSAFKDMIEWFENTRQAHSVN